MKKRLLFNFFAVLSAVIFMVLFLLYPDAGRTGAGNGLLLCGRVVIPSLFPFTACMLFLTRRKLFDRMTFMTPLTNRIFHLSGEAFGIFLFSFFGGYPVGAKLLDAGVRKGCLSQRSASLLLLSCVNAGPAFLVLAVGDGIYHSREAGFLLLAAHVSAAWILAFITGFFQETKHPHSASPTAKTEEPLADSFVLAVTDAADALLHICAYVVLFSTVLAFLPKMEAVFPPVGALRYILEVTCAVGFTRRLPLSAFLLGFAGLSVWCQVISVTKSLTIRFFPFVLARLAHGALSAFLTLLFLKIHPVALSAFSANSLSFSATYDGVALSLSLAVMVILLFLSVFSENKCGNLQSDLI